ncbi:MAG: thioesterase family protein [Acidimicrobiales bacterium]
MIADSLFRREGDYIVATERSRGPWVDDALHGGPTAALLVDLCESEPSMVPMQTTRLTVELLSAVPMTPLRPELKVVRDGKRIRLIEADLFAGDRRVASARLAQIRTTKLVLPSETPEHEGPRVADVLKPIDSHRSLPPGADDTVRFHSHSTEHRFAEGTWIDNGPVFDWIRLLVPVFPGAAISPTVRVVAVSDFGNGVSAPLPFDSWLFINPDLSIHLHRMPVGEWIGLEAHCHVEANGIGQSNAELHDQQGHLGHANQSLLLDDQR